MAEAKEEGPGHCARVSGGREGRSEGRGQGAGRRAATTGIRRCPAGCIAGGPGGLGAALGLWGAALGLWVLPTLRCVPFCPC